MTSIVAEDNLSEVPETLFHYTALDSLALILKNKTLRLNPLTCLDDPQESMSVDASGYARYVFVSCWTDDKTESIPMWNMYAGLDAGVRIEMEIDPFKRYSYSPDTASSETGIPVDHITIEGGTKETFLPLRDMKTCVTSAMLSGTGILKKVHYTSDPELLVPKIINSTDDKIIASLGKIGTYKSDYWVFQKEWRYMLCFLPMNLFGDPDTVEQRFNQAFFDALNETIPAPFQFYDLHLRESAINNMRFVLSPKMTPGNKALAETLFNTYGLSSCVEESALTGRL